MRRAQIDHAFNWILVLFAGAFFLLLFIALARFIISTGEARNDVDSLASVDSLIERSRANNNILTTAFLPEIELSCNKETFIFSLRDNTLEYYAHTIFAPKRFSGETLVFSQNFTVGVPITTFTHFYPRNTLYLTKSTLENMFPDTVTTQRFGAALEDINTQGYEGVVVVSDEAATFNGKITGRNVRGILVKEGAKTVQFYTYRDGFQPVGTPQPYYGQEFLYGAIATGDAQLYACAIQNTHTHLTFLAQLNQERTQRIKDAEEWGVVCESAYQVAISTFIALQTPSPLVISQAQSQLQSNARTLQGKSCPNIL